MNTITLKKINRDDYGKLQLLEVNYDIDSISTIRIGKMKDFHEESDIIHNGFESNDGCIFIQFNKENETATFDDGWEITFE